MKRLAPGQCSPALQADRLRADVVHYAAMGEHHTGTAVDHATSDWIRGRMQDLGFDARLDPWSLRQFNLQEAWVELYGARIDAFPLWHPTAIGPEPLQAVISTDPEPGQIGLVQFSELMVTPKSDHAEKIGALAEAGVAAIIACTPHGSGEIYAPNVIPPLNQQPWPVPVLLVAPAQWHVLANAAAFGDEVRACLKGTDETTATAKNVVAKLERGRRWIVISTPQSGWFRCAGERGAGVALLLELAQWAQASDLPQSFLFLSNSGHEIGHMGIHHLMNQDILPPPEDTDCWVHLGASIGTQGFRTDQNGISRRDGPNTEGLLLGSSDMIGPLAESFADLPYLTPSIYNRKHGEIRWILERGFKGFALMGPQKCFHLASDGPENVDPRQLTQIAEAMVATLSNWT